MQAINHRKKLLSYRQRARQKDSQRQNMNQCFVPREVQHDELIRKLAIAHSALQTEHQRAQ
jgi:hypothetical protein